MAEARAIIENIELGPEHDGISPLYSPSLGYAYSEANFGISLVTLVGFSGQRQKSIPVSNSGIRSVTKFDMLQDEERSIKMQARGIGTRMYNTAEACLGTGEGDSINAYAFTVDPTKIVDKRRGSDGTFRGRLAQAAKQMARITQVQVMSLETTIEGIHESFGDPDEVDAVLYSQSATMQRQQKRLGGVKQPAGIPPEFMVIRNPHIIMNKIGEYRG